MEKTSKCTDLCIGLSNLELSGRVFDFGHGIQLRTTFAHLFSTEILAFERPQTPTSFHPGPWQAVSAKSGEDITAELFLPEGYKHSRLSGLEVGTTIVSLLRLWVDPGITIQVLTHGPITQLKERAGKDKGGEQVAMVHGRRERHIQIGLITADRIIESIDWVVDHWVDAVDLRAQSPEFDLALETFDNAQCIPNSAMMLVSLWGALEAIFAPHKAELVFRVSAQLAAFLEPRGVRRLEKQREIVKMYNLRSAAAHGFPKHRGEDLVKTFELLRIAIIRMIERKEVPNKEKLEQLLFT
jgi:hypothetical protein